MKKIIDFEIQENRRLNEAVFLLALHGKGVPDVLPGQFVNVRVDGSPSTFLRRPISVYDFDGAKGTLRLLVKIAGRGTRQLSRLRSGEKLNVILPLGNGFPLPDQGDTLLIGGGVGIAPLYYLSRMLAARGKRPTMLVGLKTAGEAVLENEYEKLTELHFTTEDGTKGEKGYPTAHSLLKRHFDTVICCGPEPMMKAVARYAASEKSECFVSLENRMACGVGACLCCVTETKEGNKCVCTEGPVFNVKDLSWQI